MKVTIEKTADGLIAIARRGWGYNPLGCVWLGLPNTIEGIGPATPPLPHTQEPYADGWAIRTELPADGGRLYVCFSITGGNPGDGGRQFPHLDWLPRSEGEHPY